MTLDYIAHLRHNGELMAKAARIDMHAHVPTCPEWDVTQLVAHTGRHHRWVRNAVEGGGEEPADTEDPGLAGEELLDWFRRGWTDLADLLSEMDDDKVAWSWAGDNRVGFWKRRTALETLVHRWDAENATGATSLLDPALAADGVDEMLFIFFPDTETHYSGAPGTVGFETTDVPGSWLVQLEDGSIPSAARLQGETPTGDAVVSGPAETLLLSLWGRFAPEAVDVGGDVSVYEALRKWLD